MYIPENLDVGGPAFFQNSVFNVGTNLKTFLADYRRPVLKYVSATTVDVENNTGTANETKIVFPDGEVRKVVEDTSSTHKYRRFIITATATFSSGTEDSGLRSSLSEATNTWYAIYAVKSKINPGNFILSGDTTLPLQGSVATLNTNYGGENTWVYLGLIRNGDNSGATGNIITFTQSGYLTLFRNTATAKSSGTDGVGTVLANATNAASLTYSYAAGTGTTDIPNNINICVVGGNVNVGATGSGDMGITSAGILARGYSTASFMLHSVCSILDGITLTGPAASNFNIYLNGFIDGSLGVGANPFI